MKTDRDAPQAEVISPGWLQSSKRALLAPVGLGTIDQAMLGAIGVRHAFVRLFALARKVVVFDEIHAYDLYMNVIIERLLAWLQVLDAKVILLSATLPESVHQRLAAAFGNAEISETVADPAPYPRLTLTRGATGIRSITSPIPRALTKTVRIEALETEDATRSGIDWLRAAIGRGGCVAWIRNTVREAQEAWHLLRDSGIEAQLLHSRFTRYDRNLKEEALIDMLGKPSDCSKRPPSLVVVATQVIEQSVDIDFDAMLSDLAPVDLLLQRAGRLWRHFDRPSEVRRGHREPVLAILLPDQDHRFRMEFGASAYVYDAETLSRSACLVLKSTYWDIPVDCRRLVAALYDRGAAYWSAERQGVDPVRLEDVRTKEKAAETRLTHRSKTILVSRPGVIPEMRDAMRDGDTDTDVALATRHGKRSQAVCLFKVAPEGLEAIGKPGKPCQLPQPDDFTDRLQFEEAIALSTVSLPPFTAGKDPVPTGVSELAEIATWWKRHHPYDDRLFVLLDGNGTSTLYAGTLLYSAEEGLRLARATSADASHTHEED